MLEFSDAERAELDRTAIKLGDAPSDAVQLATSWAAHVEKIDADRVRSPEDHSVWTEYDLAAALFMRDFVEDALTALSDGLRGRIQSTVDVTDERFRSFTVEDPLGRIGPIADVDLTGRPWWWHRVPVDGPIADFLVNPS